MTFTEASHLETAASIEPMFVIKFRGTPMPDTTPTVLQFRVWLKGLSPMVWRRVQVPVTTH